MAKYGMFGIVDSCKPSILPSSSIKPTHKLRLYIHIDYKE